MKTIRSIALLLSVASGLAGCKTAPPPQSAQTGSSYNRPDGADEYNRAYQAESHHRHHRGRRDEGPNDNWTSYDRPDTSDERSGSSGAGGYLPRTNPTRVSGGQETHSSGPHSSRAVNSAPGEFDFYLLNLSWSPEFCHGHPSAAECAQHRAFTLHGLWPQNNNGTYPEDCSEASGPASPSPYADIYPDASLLQHEWQTHGTCSGLAPDAFLALSRRAEQTIQVPAELAHLTEQLSLTPSQVATMFTRSNPGLPASSLAISCGNNYLTAVEVCLDKSLKPGSCSAVRTCGASRIRISPPQ